MTEEEYKERLRLEMRALAATIYNNRPHHNHDADIAVCSVAQAIEKRFPETLRESCARIEPMLGMYGNLDPAGERLGLPRVWDRTDDKTYEPDRDYRERIRARMLEILQ